MSKDYGFINPNFLTGMRKAFLESRTPLFQPHLSLEATKHMSDLVSNSIDFSGIDKNLAHLRDPKILKMLIAENPKESDSRLAKWIAFDSPKSFKNTKLLAEKGWIVSPTILFPEEKWDSTFSASRDWNAILNEIRDFATDETNHFFTKDYILGGIPTQQRNELRDLVRNKHWYSARLLTLTLIDKKLVDIAEENDNPATDTSKMNLKLASFFELFKGDTAQKVWCLFEDKPLRKWFGIHMEGAGPGKMRNGMCHGDCPEEVTQDEALQAISALARVVKIGQGFKVA